MLTWLLLTIDAFVSAVIALFVFFQPHVVGDFVFNRVTDGVHWHLIRCVGAQLLAGAYISFRFRNSSSQTHTVCHLLKIVPSMLTLLVAFQCRSMTPELIDLKYVQSIIYLNAATLIIHLVFLVGSGWHIGMTALPNNRIGDCLYQLDAITCIAVGAAWITFPNWLLHRQVVVSLDDSHALCGRMMGVLFISSYSVSSHALHWMNKQYRYIAVSSRVVCCAGILTAQLWSQHAYHRDWSDNHWVGITLFSTWTFFSLAYSSYLFFSGTNEKKTKSK